MAGTTMTLHRYGIVNIDWNVQEIVVDQEFIDKHGLVIPIEYPFEPNKGLIEVYFNGQFLHSGGGYEELEDAIKLNLGVDEEGNPIQLIPGDEIFIKVYKNQYCSRGGATVSGTEFYFLRKEIQEARSYRDGTAGYPTLKDRLDEIQDIVELIYSGHSNVQITYEYNQHNQIVKEIVTGDLNLVREFTYTDFHEVETEKIIYEDGRVTVRTYHYDPVTKRLLRTSVSTE